MIRKSLRFLPLLSILALVPACGGTNDEVETAEHALCPAGNYTADDCHDGGTTGYSGKCTSGLTYSWWNCTQYTATINGKVYRYRAYCGPQQEGCAGQVPRTAACVQNC